MAIGQLQNQTNLFANSYGNALSDQVSSDTDIYQKYMCSISCNCWVLMVCVLIKEMPSHCNCTISGRSVTWSFNHIWKPFVAQWLPWNFWVLSLRKRMYLVLMAQRNRSLFPTMPRIINWTRCDVTSIAIALVLSMHCYLMPRRSIEASETSRNQAARVNIDEVSF